MNKYNLLDKNYKSDNKNIFSNKNDFSKIDKLFVYNPYTIREEQSNKNSIFFKKDNKN